MEENNEVTMAQASGKAPAIIQKPKAADIITEKDMATIIAEAEKRQELTKRLYMIALRATNCNDWIDQNGTPYLEYEGARKIARDIGLEIRNVQMMKQQIKDDKGEYIIFSYTGEAVWQGKSTPEMGTCSTRDKFFAERYDKTKGEKYLLPLSEINIVDVMKKGHTNLMNRCVKSALGLSFTWEEIDQATNGVITRDKCTGVSYTKGKRGGSTTKADPAKVASARSEVWDWILEFNSGDLESSKQTLQAMTAFEGKDGKKFPGYTDIAKVSEGVLRHLHPKVKNEITAYREQMKNEEAVIGGDE